MDAADKDCRGQHVTGTAIMERAMMEDAKAAYLELLAAAEYLTTSIDTENELSHDIRNAARRLHLAIAHCTEWASRLPQPEPEKKNRSGT
jgi:hypothetical protein